MSATLKIVSNPGIFNDYENQIDFDNIAGQTSYWDSKVTSTYSDLQIKFVNDHLIKIKGNYNSMKNASYCFVDTTINGVSKRYYYFINEIKLLAYGMEADDNLDDTIQLEIEEDVFQTYMFNYEIKESFIKREHQDRFSAKFFENRIYNIETENLDIGNEYNIEEKSAIGNPDKKIWYYIYCKEPICSQHTNELGIDETPDRTYIRKEDTQDLLNYQGLCSGYYIYLVTDLSALKWGSNNQYPMTPITVLLNNDKIVKIVASRYLPCNIIYDSVNLRYTITSKEAPDYPGVDVLIGTYIVGGDTTNMIFIKTFNQENCFSPEYEISVTPLNMSAGSSPNIQYESKLYSYPYRAKRINNQGCYSIIKNEDFNWVKGYKVQPGLVNSSNQVVIPLKSNGKDLSYFHKNISNITSEVNLITTAWLNYKSQNSASINGGLVVKGAIAGAGIIAGIATQNYLAAGAAAFAYGTQIANELVKRQDIKATPDEVNQSPDDVYNPILTEYDLRAYEEKIVIKDQYLNKIWQYFMKFGYACNNIKVPNLRTRYYYNYIQTIGISILANLNVKQIQELKKIYDNGIRIWHYRTGMTDSTFKFNDYSKENAEMSLL